MRASAIFFLTLIVCASALAQKDDFPLTAKVVSSTEETVPGTGGIVEQKTQPAVRAQFPNTPVSSTRRVQPESYIATRAEIGERIHILRGGALIDPGDYTARIDKRTARLLLKDRNGKTKISKFYVISVEAR